MSNLHPVWNNFFVLEGLDGSGTTSQLKKLISFGRNKGIDVFGTWEPTDNPVGKLIRKILHRNITVEPETMARLFTSDRYEHLYGKNDGIRKKLDDGNRVICDRYFFSSLAYQSLDTDFDRILSLNTFPLPEKLFYIDVQPETCVKRRSERKIEELFDHISLQEELQKNYMRAFDKFRNSGMEIHIIDGEKNIDDVFTELKDLIF